MLGFVSLTPTYLLPDMEARIQAIHRFLDALAPETMTVAGK